MTVLHDVPVVPTQALPHPAACPSWCKDRHTPGAHLAGPAGVWHWSRQYHLVNPRPLACGASLLRAELVRSDTSGASGGVRLFVQADGDIDLTSSEVDGFIAEAEVFVDTLRALRHHMG